jgi:ATP-dependent Zn protease
MWKIGWSGAELAQLLQEGAMMAVRNGHSQIVQRDLELAVDRITIGPKRSGVGSGLAVHRRMATLEVGFALTSHLLRRLEGAKLEYCERVSIIPRGEVVWCFYPFFFIF